MTSLILVSVVLCKQFPTNETGPRVYSTNRVETCLNIIFPGGNICYTQTRYFWQNQQFIMKIYNSTAIILKIHSNQVSIIYAHFKFSEILKFGKNG